MNERIERILNHPMRTPIVIGTLSFAGGVGLGFFLGYKKKLKQNVVVNFDIVKEEDPQTTLDFSSAIAEVKQDRIIEQTPVDIPPDSLLTKDGEPVIIKDLLDDEPLEAESERQNIFEGTDSEWDNEEELKNRRPDEPYILHQDEFFNNETNYAQRTLTYYAGDHIMTDEEDVPVYNFDQLVGALKFGHGSNDPNVLYVRNEKHKAEYEILYNSGLYSQEVLGLEMETNERAKDLKHSNPPKFRSD